MCCRFLLARRLTALAIFFFLAAVQHQAPAADKALPEGLVKAKPASGRFVKTPQGYMVPYTTTIPGTNVKFEMVPIPGGTFVMGSPESEPHRKPNEAPQCTVRVAPFWFGKHEIRWAEYKQYMALHDIFKDFETHKLRVIEQKHKADVITAPSNLYDPSFTFVNGEEPELPAVSMSQYAAKQYTKWLTALTGQFYRLPSEAEWEYACRAGSKTAYSFGDDMAKLDEYAWHYKNANDTTHPVGQKKPNAWGLYDMHGNVSEWVLDGLDKNADKRNAGKTVTALGSVNWPKKLFPRIVKGGNWDLEPHECRSAARLGSDDDNWRSEDPNVPLSPWWFTSGESLGVGFRILRPLADVPKGERERFWQADLKQTKEDIKYRIDEEGRGARGYVDPTLPAAIEKLKKLRAKGQ